MDTAAPTADATRARAELECSPPDADLNVIIGHAWRWEQRLQGGRQAAAHAG